MTRDSYLFADGEVEAEHLWVNEWTGLHDAPSATVVVAPNSPGRPYIDDECRDALCDQLLLDIAEIERARDALARDEPAARAGGLGPLMFAVRNALAGLVKGAR